MNYFNFKKGDKVLVTRNWNGVNNKIDNSWYKKGEILIVETCVKQMIGFTKYPSGLFATHGGLTKVADFIYDTKLARILYYEEN